MKIAVFGSGGIGGFLGGALCKSGEEVWFLARGKHLDAMREGGLRIESVSLGNFQVSVKATDKPSDIGPVDLVLFSVKSYDTEAALEQIGPLIGKQSGVLSFQNGVDNEDKIANMLGKEHAIGGSISVESYIEEPGKIVQATGPWRIVIGEMDGSMTGRIKIAQDALVKAGLICEISNHIRDVIWEKFLFICATAGVCSVSRSTIGEMLAFQPTRDMFVASMKEIEAIASAKGIELPDDIIAKTIARSDSLNKAAKPSMLRDLERGNRLEVDALNGTVSRIGHELSVATPINDFIYASLKLQDLSVAGRLG